MSEEQDPSGSVQSLLGQLRHVTDRLAGLPSMPSLPGLPSTPGALTAAQLKAIASVLAAQRTSIAAMQSQLAAFDEQLEVLDRVLTPFVEWSSTWAGVEKRLTGGSTSG